MGYYEKIPKNINIFNNKYTNLYAFLVINCYYSSKWEI